jgi:hypothetical protein
VRRLPFADRETLWLDLAMVALIVLSAMNAILVVPRISYLLTFICLTLLYAAMKMSRGMARSEYNVRNG